MSADVPEELVGKYMTEAVESGVLDVEREVVGHVGLLDLDETALGEAVDVAERTPGVSAVLQSSERSYHVWSLAVEPLGDWVERAADLEGVDVEHVSLSERRECGVLRIDAKRSATTGDVVKRPPRLRRLVETPTERPLSEPHARLLRGAFGADLAVDDSRDWVGHSVNRRTYLAEIRNGGDA